MRAIVTIFIATLVMPSMGFSEATCFPVGRARHDRECYDMLDKNSCLETTDIFSCAWGQRTENPISDDELLVCDTARCPNGLDGDEEDYLPPEE